MLGWLDQGSRTAADGFGLWLKTNLAILPGWGDPRLSTFAPLNLAGFDPIFWGFAASLSATVLVSLGSRPQEDLVNKYFPES